MNRSYKIIRPSGQEAARPAEPITLEFARPRRTSSGRYILSEALAAAANAALELDQPLLVTGESGCGKTELAWAIAAQLGCDVLEFHTKSTSSGRDLLYQVDTLRRFHDASTGNSNSRELANYLSYQALGMAIRSPTTTVVLIDEIDKAAYDFPNDLLNELEQMEFAIPETEPPLRFRATAKHFVLITSNSERRLPMPFLRRCVHAHIEFPDIDTLTKIIEIHGITAPRSFTTVAVRRFLELRAIDDIVKPPATGELIAWLRLLGRMGVEEDVLETASLDTLPALGVLIKTIDDLRALRTS